MGYIKHHAIIVTSWNDEAIKDAIYIASGLFGNQVSSLVESSINGYYSFFIAPDGSKEGWDQSNEGDERREKFIRWINERAYEDGSNNLSYAELYYGEDNGRAAITNHN